MLKRSDHIFFSDHFINSYNLSTWPYTEFLGENWCWSLLGLKGLSDASKNKGVLDVNKSLPSLPRSRFCLVTQRSSSTRCHDFIPIEKGRSVTRRDKNGCEGDKAYLLWRGLGTNFCSSSRFLIGCLDSSWVGSPETGKGLLDMVLLETFYSSVINSNLQQSNLVSKELP